MVVAAILGELLRQAEVAQVAVVGGVDEHVPGLHVAMHEPARVRGVERVRDLADEPERTLRLERPVLEQRAQVGAVDEPVGEVQLAVASPAAYTGRIPGWSIEAASRDSRRNRSRNDVVARELGRDQLQRDRPVERRARSRGTRLPIPPRPTTPSIR